MNSPANPGGTHTPQFDILGAEIEGAARYSEQEGVALIAARKHIYVRAVHGLFANWRIALVVLTQVVFYGLQWLPWNGRQAVLFDLANRKFYIFSYVFWPQDFIFLTLFMSVAAFSLFFFTALAGRVWCGFACPQTVYTQIFLWIEEWVEGNRLNRIKLDRQPWSKKLLRKVIKHGLWIALAVWTGIAFVGYFTPIRTLVQEIPGFNLGPWELAWILIYGGATYGFAGWMREQVCKYMCPYARFQSVMCDADTLVVTYDAPRGEPRGPRSRGVDPKAAGLGSCVDCGICVQVCPVGIDIRNGWQYECIGCSACIDGCNQVMDKMGYPRGLIRYTTENVVEGKTEEKAVVSRMWRPRVINYGLMLLATIIGLSVMLYLRVPLRVDVIRDRGVLARENSQGLVENVYRLQIMNITEQVRQVTITADGMEGVQLVVAQPITLPPQGTVAVPAVLQVDPGKVAAGSYPVHFLITDTQNESISVEEKSMFILR